MGLTVPTLAAAIARAHAAMAVLADPLNAADARLGDGDTGTMLARLIGVFAAVDLDAAPDLGAAFMALGKAGAASTGSSLGTLVITAMLTAGRATAGATELDWDRLGPLLAGIRDAAMARGKAELGAKTIIDGLDALAGALDGLDDPAALATAADAAMTDVLAEFRARPSGMGRARMFGERSIGLDDPGMLALAGLVRAVSGQGTPAHAASGLA
jgi:dihydroxyacetone kinase